MARFGDSYASSKTKEVRIRITEQEYRFYAAVACAFFPRSKNGDPCISAAIGAAGRIGGMVIIERGPRVLEADEGYQEDFARAAEAFGVKKAAEEWRKEVAARVKKAAERKRKKWVDHGKDIVCRRGSRRRKRVLGVGLGLMTKKEVESSEK